MHPFRYFLCEWISGIVFVCDPRNPGDVFFPLLFHILSLLAVPVIKASELWAAMEPELLVTVRAELEPTSDTEGEQQEHVEEEKEAEDDRATAVKIAQYLRVNKYRWC